MMADAAPVAAVSGEALFDALSGRHASDSTAAQLRRYLIERGLQPGDRLPGETTLAAEIGASRLTVREGLRGLEALGLLEARAGAGWYLRHFDVSTAARTFAWSLAFHPSALLDLLDVRRATEALVVASLAGRLHERDLAMLDELVERMRWQASRGKLFVAEDREFHTRLFAASGNRVALALADVYWSLLEALYRNGLPGPTAEDAPAVAETHARIVAALRRGESDRAGELLMRSHDEAQQRFTAWLAQHDDAGAGQPGAAVQSLVQTALLSHEPTSRRR
jgi:DNA-binding FadR family transcriptional regulator